MSTPTIPGIESLWMKTRGDPRICVAILDGAVDKSHPCFKGTQLTQLETLVPNLVNQGWASQHGTHVASIIFGQHHSPVQGIAPNCRGLIVPIFRDEIDSSITLCSQIDLARAITQAVEQGANVINISGGQLTSSPESDQLLANAIQLCQKKNVLIVAAAGNDGCECLHLPAALESVLAVGAMNLQGIPLDFSNWGETYKTQGILAPGENILGATPGGGMALKSGTSFAAPLVSGIVALLLSIQLQRGERPDPHGIRDAILSSALPCSQQDSAINHRCLAGRLNIPGAYSLITLGEMQPMSEHKQEENMMQLSEANESSQESLNPTSEANIEEIQPTKALDINAHSSVSNSEMSIQASSVAMPTAMSNEPLTTQLITTGVSEQNSYAISPSGCDCGGNGAIQLVYAIGQLGTDFGTQARQDSFTQVIPPNMSLLEYLNNNPYEAQSLMWTLSLDATPIYAIVPTGPYANVTYERLLTYLGDGSIERISVPGYISGSVRLMSGQVVPVIIPEIRGMYSWSADALVEAVATEDADDQLRDYLNRIYYDYRNLGITPEERALNFSATNAFQVSEVIAQATGTERVLDSIAVEKSPICRPDSDCYDVKLSFFDPENNQRSNRIFRFTVDVSDVIPVTIGQMRSWAQA